MVMGAVAGGGVVKLPGEARTIDVGGFTVDVVGPAPEGYL